MGPPKASTVLIKPHRRRLAARRNSGRSKRHSAATRTGAVVAVGPGSGRHRNDTAGRVSKLGGIVLAMTLNSCIASTGRLVSCCGRVRPTAFETLPPSSVKILVAGATACHAEYRVDFRRFRLRVSIITTPGASAASEEAARFGSGRPSSIWRLTVGRRSRFETR